MPGGTEHGFLLDQGTFTTIDPPGSDFTQAFDINARGQIVGDYRDASGTYHGFLLDKGIFTTIDPPGLRIHPSRWTQCPRPDRG
jgi:probable HAF family extracellular repeat protein